MRNQASLRLTANADKIMMRWETRATKELLAANGVESLALRNSLSEFLTQVADALSTTIDRTEVRVKWDRAESKRVGEKHGKERADSNYTMDQMIIEYHILRQCICDVMEEEAPLSPTEREVIVCAVEQAVNDAATQFSETLRRVQERIAAAVTHDLRSPITSAKLSAQMILRRPGDSALCISSGQRILANMNRVDEMIQELLDASGVRAGQEALPWPEECDLDLLTREVADEFNLIYKNRFVVDSKGPSLGHWSKSALRRVIENLATNAVKYGSPLTPITMRVSKAGASAEFSLRNEGNPISAQEQKLLFEPFHRTKSARSQSGWGIGLSVVKQFAESLRGSVHLESSGSAGTTFTVQLPRDARPL